MQERRNDRTHKKKKYMTGERRPLMETNSKQQHYGYRDRRGKGTTTDILYRKIIKDIQTAAANLLVSTYNVVCLITLC